ncbi:hypothetical protein WS62_17535 [Burkholderia sp. ABCPW 14]|nr:hypothetical protein WS62_17535 [Burkholderia sp. ABCPW 14]
MRCRGDMRVRCACIERIVANVSDACIDDRAMSMRMRKARFACAAARATSEPKRRRANSND